MLHVLIDLTCAPTLRTRLVHSIGLSQTCFTQFSVCHSTTPPPQYLLLLFFFFAWYQTAASAVWCVCVCMYACADLVPGSDELLPSSRKKPAVCGANTFLATGPTRTPSCCFQGGGGNRVTTCYIYLHFLTVEMSQGVMGVLPCYR